MSFSDQDSDFTKFNSQFDSNFFLSNWLIPVICFESSLIIKIKVSCLELIETTLRITLTKNVPDINTNDLIP